MSDSPHFLDDLRARGLIEFSANEEALRKKNPTDITFYIGFDPSAASLQIGNLIPLIFALRLAKAGLKPILLFGGSTGTIGDPTGKVAERPLLDKAQIEANVRNHSNSAREIFARFDESADCVNNMDWTHDKTLLDFLREVGKFLTVNYMIAKETVKNRLEGDGISYAEFSYMLLQAYDFHHLLINRGCSLQIGGADQWGNITAGLELIRKKEQKEAYALAWPLLLNSSGKKFGKSESGTLWLSKDLTSPYKFHQFWLNSTDNDVVRYLKIFTFLSLAEIGELEKQVQDRPQEREAQKVLADTLCNMVHGEAATEDAKKCAQALFGGSLDGLSEETLLDIFADAPSSEMRREDIKSLNTVDLFVNSKLVASKGEARRLITSGGAYINNLRAGDDSSHLSNYDKNFIVLRSGKKNYHLIKIVG